MADQLLNHVTRGRAMFPGVIVGAGLLSEVDPLHIDGLNSAIVAVEETVWAEGGIYAYKAAAVVHTISSSSVNDDGAPAGTGAQTVRVTGLLATWAEASEVVTLDGQTGVPTVGEYIRINKLEVVTVGATLANEGIIYAGTGAIVAGKPNVVQAHMPIGANVSQQAVYSVPLARTLYLINQNFNANNAAADSVRWRVMVRAFGGVFQPLVDFSSRAQYVGMPVLIPIPIAAKSDVEVRATGPAGGIAANVSLEAILADV